MAELEGQGLYQGLRSWCCCVVYQRQQWARWDHGQQRAGDCKTNHHVLSQSRFPRPLSFAHSPGPLPIDRSVPNVLPTWLPLW